MIEHDRLISGQTEQDDFVTDRAVRPRLLTEFVGQPSFRQQHEIFLAAAKARREPLDHMLLFGPPGLGKTTLAQIIAREMETAIRITSGPVLARPGDVAAFLTTLRRLIL